MVRSLARSLWRRSELNRVNLHFGDWFAQIQLILDGNLHAMRQVSLLCSTLLFEITDGTKSIASTALRLSIQFKLILLIKNWTDSPRRGILWKQLLCPNQICTSTQCDCRKRWIWLMQTRESSVKWESKVRFLLHFAVLKPARQKSILVPQSLIQTTHTPIFQNTLFGASLKSTLSTHSLSYQTGLTLASSKLPPFLTYHMIKFVVMVLRETFESSKAGDLKGQRGSFASEI